MLLRSPCDEDDVVVARGVLVTNPVRTGFDLARGAPDLWAAVEELDCLFRGRHPVFLELLAAYAGARPRWKGVDRARCAVALASTETRSRGETWLGLAWTVTAGLPPPRLNTPVHDADDPHDAVVGTPDLLDEASGLAGEYDGRPHRSARQQHADAVRGDLINGVGLTLVRATAVDRRSPGLMARRLLAAHRRALEVRRRTWWVAPTHDGARGGRPAAGAVESAVVQRA